MLDFFTQTIHFLLGISLLGAALWHLWVAYRIKFQQNTTNLRMGNTALPGAQKLSPQFAQLYFAYGLCFAAAFAAYLVFATSTVAIAIMFIASMALGLRRQVLVRALEKLAGLP
jgi:hypothetical protein